MKAIINSVMRCLALFAVILAGVLAVEGAESIHYQRQLSLSKTSPTEIIDKLNGCRVVYHTCTVEVSGDNPRHVAGKFNGVRIPASKEPYKF